MNALDNRNPHVKRNLENQLTELYYHVWGFASTDKYEEMGEIHREKARRERKRMLPVFEAIYGYGKRGCSEETNSKEGDGKETSSKETGREQS
jgi:hypothetical protein